VAVEEVKEQRNPRQYEQRDKKNYVQKELTDGHTNDRRSGTGREYLVYYVEIAPGKQEEDTEMSAISRMLSTRISTLRRETKIRKRVLKLMLKLYLQLMSSLLLLPN
jgi:hypothetical protein